MKDSFWKSDGRRAHVSKAVVSSSGHAVARNYAIKSENPKDLLRPGDLGITMRMDRLVEGMTPEQRLAAQGLAEAMFKDLMRALGKEEIEGSGIPSGSYIQIVFVEGGPEIESNGRTFVIRRLVKETRIGIHTQCFDVWSFDPAVDFIPWSSIVSIKLIDKEEIARRVVEGFIDAVTYTDTCDPCNTKVTVYFNDDPETNFATFYDMWGEENYVRMICAIRRVSGQAPRRFDPHRSTEWNKFVEKHDDGVDQVLTRISSEVGLQRVADKAASETLRLAAKKLLEERKTQRSETEETHTTKTHND